MGRESGNGAWVRAVVGSGSAPTRGGIGALALSTPAIAPFGWPI
ncbi:MAG TPA: hypothetical protein VH561_20250 [Micromonosporaceae bacterium]